VTVAEFVLNMVAPWVRKSLDVSGRYRAVSLHEQIYDMIEKRNAGPAARASVDVNMKHFQASLEALKNGTVSLDAERNDAHSVERQKRGSAKN